MNAEVYDYQKPTARAQPATPEALAGGPRVWTTVVRRGHGRDHGIAVGAHLAMLVDDMRPAALIEDDSPPVGIDQLSQDDHVARVLILAEFYTGTLLAEPRRAKRRAA